MRNEFQMRKIDKDRDRYIWLFTVVFELGSSTWSRSWSQAVLRIRIFLSNQGFLIQVLPSPGQVLAWNYYAGGERFI